MKTETTETLRSTYLPEGILGGANLFLVFSNGWYRVETRWQIFKRSRSLDKAAAYYENASLGVF